MRKLFTNLVVLLTLLSAIPSVQSCSNGDEPGSVKGNGLNSEKFDYRLFYDTLLTSPRWRSLPSTAERIEACQLPAEALAAYTTAELVDIWLYYPYRADFVFVDDPMRGFESSSSAFNGYRELRSRDDAARAILEFYDNVSLSLETVRKADRVYPKSLDIIDCMALEILLLSDDFPEMYEGDNLILLEKVVREKLDYKLSRPDIYSEYSNGFLRDVLDRIDQTKK